MLDFGGLTGRKILQFVIYRINHRAVFCWKTPSYSGRKKRGRERRRKSTERYQSYSSNSAEGTVSFAADLPHPAAQPCLYPALCHLLCPSSSQRWSHVPAESVSKGRLSAGIYYCLPTWERRQSSSRKTCRAVAEFARITLIPVKIRLKHSCLWDDSWEQHQPKELMVFSILVNLECKVTCRGAPSSVFRPCILQ